VKVLVTGAGGFIGRVLCRQLVERHHEVIGLDVCDNPDLNVASWVQVGGENAFDVSHLPEGCDAIIHLAQSPAYRQGAAGETDVFNVNVAMLAALLKWASEADVKQFITASTGTVYEPFDNAMCESTLARPTGYYGASKLAAEIIADAYRDRFNVAHLRLFFVYGPHQKGMLIARLIDSVLTESEVSLPEIGDGLVFVPTYVEDVARCFIEALEENWSGPVNVASPEAVSFKTLLETISKAANKPLQLKRQGEAPTRPIVPNLDKLSALTDMAKFTPLAQGIQASVLASDR